MNLKILLPHGVFANIHHVNRIVAETTEGSYGFLPQRLDCTAALVPGILYYETEANGGSYVAVTEGILIKAGPDVTVSVRHAIGNVPLGKLQEMVKKERMELDELEVSARMVMARLETGFLKSFQKLRK